MNSDQVEFTRGVNLVRNLKRIFAASPRGRRAEVARQAGLTDVHLSRLLRNGGANPRLGTVEALAIALEVPVEVLIAAAPTDLDLGVAAAVEAGAA